MTNEEIKLFRSIEHSLKKIAENTDRIAGALEQNPTASYSGGPGKNASLKENMDFLNNMGLDVSKLVGFAMRHPTGFAGAADDNDEDDDTDE